MIILKYNQFLEKYIDLENKILNLIESGRNIEDVDQKLKELINEFYTCWADYQDTWDDKLW
jgi:hypothetical protein